MTQQRAPRNGMLFLGLALGGVGAIALASRYVEITHHAALLVAVFSPFLMPALPLAAVALVIARRRVAAICAAVLSTAALITQLPEFTGSRHDPHAIPLQVMSINTLQGAADAATIVRYARDADVLSVQELTPAGLKELSAEGIDSVFPFRITKPLDGGSGAGLWSRHPLTESPDGEFEGLPIIARLGLPGDAGNPTVVVAHLSAPWPWPIEWWRADIDRVTAELSGIIGPVIAAGDFNSTRDIAQFRRLLADGFADGTARTYPSNRRLPPLLAIDHVLARECTIVSSMALTVPGSDHRALVATVEIPR